MEIKVRLSDDARKCVAFCGYVDPATKNFDPKSTGFFIGYPYNASEVLYFITAKHCVYGDDPFVIRYNKQEGSENLYVEHPQWIYHPDPNVDIALLKIDIPLHNDQDISVWPVHASLSEQRLQIKDFGPGDLCYTVGLFSHHYGKSKNIPMVHTGHIAAFSEDEKIDIKIHNKRVPVDAYVVQCSVMPGASGSPVFVRKPIKAADELHTHDASGSTQQGPRVPPHAYGAVFLLGLWHGSWEAEDATARSPSGYGIVIPAQKLLEILDLPELRESRNLILE